MKVGTRIRTRTNAPGLGKNDHNYTAHTGTITDDKETSVGIVCVKLDNCGMSGCIGDKLYYNLNEIEELQQLGYKACPCGSITSKADGICCGCEYQVKCPMCENHRFVCPIGAMLVGCGYENCRARKPCQKCSL